MVLITKFKIFYSYWIYSGKNISFIANLFCEQALRIITQGKHLSYRYGNFLLNTGYGIFWVQKPDHVYVLNPNYEPHIAKIIRENEKYFSSETDKIAINLGGHIGRYVIELANRFEYQVLTFEPNPTTFRILLANIFLSGAESRVQAFSFGLGSKKSKAFFINEQSRDGSSRIAHEFEKPSKDNEIIEVGVEVFDDLRLIPNTKNLRLAIIDVEGFEKEVLIGMKIALTNMQAGHVVIEIFENSPRKQEVIAMMQGYGFVEEQIGKDDWAFRKNIHA